MTIGALVAAAGTCWVLNPLHPVAPLYRQLVSESTAQTEVPTALRQRADCMYDLLKSTPSVNEPKLTYVTREGWTHPVLSYRARYSQGRSYPMRFEAQKVRIDHHGVWFLTTFDGPIPPDLDVTSLNSIMKTWKARCDVGAEVDIN